MAQLADSLKYRGHIKIEAVDMSSNRSTLLDEPNLIVTHGRMSIANMLAGVGSGLAITGIAFGNGGTLINNPAVAVSIDPSETTVINNIANLVAGTDYVFSVTTVQSATPTVVSHITVPSVSSLNGLSLSELALVQSDGSAFSLKRFPAIFKSTSISLIITWTLYL